MLNNVMKSDAVKKIQAAVRGFLARRNVDILRKSLKVIGLFVIGYEGKLYRVSVQVDHNNDDKVKVCVSNPKRKADFAYKVFDWKIEDINLVTSMIKLYLRFKIDKISG